jgi:hypothetical protein
MNLKTLALGFAVALGGFTGAAHAHPCSHGSCYISTGERVALDGPCGYSFIDSKGSKAITAVNGAVIARLYIDGDGSSAHAMNGGENGHAVPIGGMFLTRDGGCWGDDSTKVCVWKPGTRPAAF